MGMESFGSMPPQLNQENLEKPEEILTPEPVIEQPVAIIGEEKETETFRGDSDPQGIDATKEEGAPNQEKEEDFADKLSGHILGLKIDDPTLPDRLIEDQKIIRAKYSLPSRESISNLNEYERSLLEIAKSAGVTIKPKSECGKFFEDYPYAGGVHFGKEKKVGVDINRTSFESHAKSLGILEHELIHALQKKHSPRMPIELMEYEAYVAGGNNNYIKEHPQIARLVFDGLIGASVRHWYNQTSEERGEKVAPAWL